MFIIRDLKKEQPVSNLYQKLGIDQKDTYAFGDGVNDMEMFELVGHGIAMGKCSRSFKKTLQNLLLIMFDCAGIDKAFYKYFVKGFIIMALVQVDFFSEKLMRTVTINAIIPVDKKLNQPNKKFKTLYLLHGIFEIIQIGYVVHVFKGGHRIMI